MILVDLLLLVELLTILLADHMLAGADQEEYILVVAVVMVTILMVRADFIIALGEILLAQDLDMGLMGTVELDSGDLLVNLMEVVEEVPQDQQ